MRRFLVLTALFLTVAGSLTSGVAPADARPAAVIPPAVSPATASPATALPTTVSPSTALSAGAPPGAALPSAVSPAAGLPAAVFSAAAPVTPVPAAAATPAPAVMGPPPALGRPSGPLPARPRPPWPEPSTGPTSGPSAGPSVSPSSSPSVPVPSDSAPSVPAPTPPVPAPSAPAPSTPAVPVVDRAAPKPRVYKGYGFDACTAPSLSTMKAWRKHSKYRAVGIYFGGRARGCAQPLLTASWVASVHKAGWRLLPVYMGSQARCVMASHKRKYRMSAKDPAAQARKEAKDAVRRARALGIAPRSALYLDIEHYDTRDGSCARKVVTFVQAWAKTVRAEGYFAGFYSSASSGIHDMAEAKRAGKKNLPDALWFGRWSGNPTLRDSVLGSKQWHPHRRVHQYNGDVRERHGGHTLYIDRNYLDAPVAVVKPK